MSTSTVSQKITLTIAVFASIIALLNQAYGYVMTREEALIEFPTVICEVTMYTFERGGNIHVNVRGYQTKLVGSTYMHVDGKRTATKKLMAVTSKYQEHVLAGETMCLESQVDEAIALLYKKIQDSAIYWAEHFKKMVELTQTVKPNVVVHKKGDNWLD